MCKSHLGSSALLSGQVFHSLVASAPRHAEDTIELACVSRSWRLLTICLIALVDEQHGSPPQAWMGAANIL